MLQSNALLQLQEIAIPECLAAIPGSSKRARSSGDAVRTAFVFSAPVIIRMEYTSCVRVRMCRSLCEPAANLCECACARRIVCHICVRVSLGFRQVCDRRARSHWCRVCVYARDVRVWCARLCVNTHTSTRCQQVARYFKRIKAEHLSASSLQIVVIR